MNREILFKAKRVDNGEWVYGWLIKCEYGMCISADDALCHVDGCEWNFIDVEVDPSTVCQYTGLTDQNGVKIFDGDIAKIHYFFENYDPDTLGDFNDEANVIGKLSITYMGVYFESANAEGYLCDYLEEPEEELEVIGNIFDNPELLEEDNT